MSVWQADFYRRPLKTERGEPIWELLLCEADGSLTYRQRCLQSQANPQWVAGQFQQFGEGQLATTVQVFRPQCLGLIGEAAKQLGMAIEPTRRTYALKRLLLLLAREYPQEANYTGEEYDPLAVDRPPPLPLPEKLWGDGWRFASIEAGDLVDTFADRPIPIVEMPNLLKPIHLGLSSTVTVPGVAIDGGKASMQLARWLQGAVPVAIDYRGGEFGGLVLEAGLNDRTILATFDDREAIAAARRFEQRKQAAGGLHFLLVQPDDTGRTYSGFWLLQAA
jgi:hypothetical protein